MRDGQNVAMAGCDMPVEPRTVTRSFLWLFFASSPFAASANSYRIGSIRAPRIAGADAALGPTAGQQWLALAVGI